MVTLESRLDGQVDTMFHSALPEGCPTDPLDKQAYLRALALLALLEGQGAPVGRPELVVVEDHTNPGPDGQPSIDWGLDVDLPQRVPRRSPPTRHRVFDHRTQRCHHRSPRKLNLGRTTRLANRAQRRALRGLYATCAIPGCRVRYTRTKLHHVIWWRNGGLTDLDNLLPVCEQHHHNIHHNHWLISLGPNRELTIELPDGQIMTTGPPTATPPKPGRTTRSQHREHEGRIATAGYHRPPAGALVTISAVGLVLAGIGCWCSASACR